MSARVEIPDWWVRRINSPLYWVVAACSGISVSFCPYHIYEAGRDGMPLYHPWALANYAVIWLVVGFYSQIAFQACWQIRLAQKSNDSTLSDGSGAANT